MRTNKQNKVLAASLIESVLLLEKAIDKYNKLLSMYYKGITHDKLLLEFPVEYPSECFNDNKIDFDIHVLNKVTDLRNKRAALLKIVYNLIRNLYFEYKEKEDNELYSEFVRPGVVLK